MKLTVINSNSSGNAYLLQSSTGETLLIECGVHFSKIKKALNFNLSKVAAIVSHSHGDHACSIKDVLNAGIYVCASKETLEAKGVDKHHRATTIEPGKSFNHLGFRIKPFSVNHDVHCFGFLINHVECGVTLFLTDTYYCDYVFPGLNNIIVECNHDEEIIEANETPRFLRDRVIQSHMNFKTCKGLLKANDLSQVNNIVLIHLSESNSDAAMFKNEISKLTGKHVHIAEAGLVIENFNKEAI
jgi:phosphoribosyl 1,2-cyclic phosphodiesterase